MKVWQVQCSCGDELEFSTRDKARTHLIQEQAILVHHGVDLAQHQMQIIEQDGD